MKWQAEHFPSRHRDDSFFLQKKEPIAPLQWTMIIRVRQSCVSRWDISFVTHRLSPPRNAQWGGMCLREAARPSGDAEQVASPEKK